MVFQASEYPHRRYNPLLDEWILVSPHRTKRPWQGGHESAAPLVRPSYDPDCYLCPGKRTRQWGSQSKLQRNLYLYQ